MSDQYQEWYEKHRNAVEAFWPDSGVPDERKVEHLIDSLSAAYADEDKELIDVIVDAVYEIKNETIQIEALNELLISQAHQKHQEITKSIQDFAHPSSVRYINLVLEAGFEHLEYTCSESDVIAKWFSHALSRIDTVEALDTIKKYTNSTDEGVKREMQYRLNKCQP